MELFPRSQKYHADGKPVEGAYFFGNYDDNPLPPFSAAQATFYKDYEGEKPHYHTISEKMYLTLKGLGILVVDGKEVEMKPEQMIHVRPNEVHYVKEVLEEPLEFVVVASKKVNDKVVLE